MKIKIGMRRLLYELELFGKYNVLCGDSGTGKTTLHKLLIQKEVNPRAVKFKSDLDVIPVQTLDSEDVLSKHQGALFVIDESAMLLKRGDIASLLEKSNNYFLIISRKKFDFLPVSIDNYFRFEDTNGIMHNVPIFPRFKKKVFLGVDKIVTEDSVSGKKFFEEFFPGFVIDSAHSKSELASYVANSDGERLLVVYDAAAFAYNADSFFEAINGKTVQILDWESFENFILRQKLFGIILEQRDCDCK